MARKMKDSGVEWIGFIPDEWSIQRLRWCLKDINVKNDPIQTTQVLSLTNKALFHMKKRETKVTRQKKMLQSTKSHTKTL